MQKKYVFEIGNMLRWDTVNKRGKQKVKKKEIENMHLSWDKKTPISVFAF